MNPIIVRLQDLAREVQKCQWAEANLSLEVLSSFSNRATDAELKELGMQIFDSVRLVCDLSNSLRSNISKLAIALISMYLRLVCIFKLEGNLSAAKSQAYTVELLTALFKRTNSAQSLRTLYKCCINEIRRSALCIPVSVSVPVIATLLRQDGGRPSVAVINFIAVALSKCPTNADELDNELSSSLNYVTTCVLGMLTDKLMAAKTLAKTCLKVVVLSLRDNMDIVLEPSVRTSLLYSMAGRYPSALDITEIEKMFGIILPSDMVNRDIPISGCPMGKVPRIPKLEHQQTSNTGADTSRTIYSDRRNPSPRYTGRTKENPVIDWNLLIPMPTSKVIR